MNSLCSGFSGTHSKDYCCCSCYSISEGISMGVITYVALNLITGKAKEKKVSILMYVLAVLFVLKYVFL